MVEREEWIRIGTERAALVKTVPQGKWFAWSGDQTRILAVGNSYSEVARIVDVIGDMDAILDISTHYHMICPRLGF